ncbi:hypothetical protein KI387_039424, partial [Taxus chinensis]
MGYNIQENNERRGLIFRVNELRSRRGLVASDFELEDVNGLEQLFCNMRLRHNVDRPDEADMCVRDGRRLNIVNRFKLDALTQFNLGVER